MVERTPIRPGVFADQGLMQFRFLPSIGLVVKDFDKLGLNIQSFREPLKRAIQQVIAPSFGQNFAAGGRPDPWEPLAPDTIKLRAREGSGTKILVRTGRLQRVIQQLNIWTINKTSASIRSLPSSIAYGYVHQAGTGSFGAFKSKLQGEDEGIGIRDILVEVERKGRTAAKVAIPARPFVMLQTEDYPKLDKVFGDWLDERIVVAFGDFR